MLKRLKSTSLTEFVSTDVSLLTFRVFISLFMLTGHGWGKLMNVFSGNFQFLDPIGLGPTVSLILAAFAEGICSLLIIGGYWTRLASLVLSINMAVAIFGHHIPSGDPLFGGYELAVLYLIAFIGIFLLGPGKYSLDAKTKT